MKRAAWLLLLLLASPAQAVEPDEMLRDPALEARARSITQNIRCPVCAGQPIDDSNAPLAADLRRLVRAMLRDGVAESDILLFLRQRYGDGILFDPPSAPLLRAAPFAALLLTLLGAGLFIWRQNRKGGGV
jgi:cytochrome c-type biogenesis protein CcmH